MPQCFGCDFRQLLIKKEELENQDAVGEAKTSGHFSSASTPFYLQISLNSRFFAQSSFGLGNDPDYWAGVITHEILHNFGYLHPTGYDGSFIREFQNCLRHATDVSSLRVAFKSHDGHYLCAESGGGENLVANRTIKSTWETFTLVNQSNISSNTLPNNGDKIMLRSYNGYYVCAENGGGGEVNVTRHVGQEWEAFTILNLSSNGPILSGNYVALQTHNQHYLCAESGGGREIVANRTFRNAWETFTIEII
jgi:hypothetical protein